MRQDDKNETPMLEKINISMKEALDNLAGHRNERENADLLIKSFHASVETDVEDA